MADEAVLVEGEGGVQDFTVASGAAIAKFTLCQLADPRTASATSGTGDVFAGIASVGKSASDFSVELGLWTEGTFELTSCATSVTIVAGDLVSMSGANLIKPAAAAEILSGAIVGKALEAIASAGTGEVKLTVI